jgi:hypothetical protein
MVLRALVAVFLAALTAFPAQALRPFPSPMMVRQAASSGPTAVVSQNFTTNSTFPAWLDNSLTVGHRMQYDSTGKLTYAPNNLIQQSDNWAAAAWATVSNMTRTANNAVAPDGTTTATLLTATNANAYIQQAGATTGTPAKKITSFWVKRKTGTGTINMVDAQAFSWTPITVTSSWTQVYAVSVATTDSYIGLQIVTSGDEFWVWRGVTEAVTYQTTPTVNSATGYGYQTTSAAYYGPRFDYDPATLTARGILIEESRTNLALYCRDLTNAAWTKTNVTAAKDQTGIDGVANSASKITASAGNGTVLQSITLASSQRFQSAYVKRITGTGTVEMTTDGGSTWTAITVTASWAKVTIPAQTVTNPSVGFRIITNADAIAVDFVQNETGAFATSPIFTTSASVTRVADIIKLAGSALSTIGGAAGTVIQEYNLEGDTAATQYQIYGNTVSPLYFDSSRVIKATNGTNILSSAVTATVGTSIRAGLAWDGSGRSISANGSAAVTDANGFGTIGSTVYDGSNNGANTANGWLRTFAIYDSKLSGSTFTGKTTTGAAL